MLRILKRNLTSNVFKIKNINVNGYNEVLIKGGHNKFNLLNKGFRDIKQIGIIGWGSQAPSQALNLRDSLNSIGSDIKIKVGLRENSNSLKQITEFETGTINEVLRESDFNIILISDYAQSLLYKDIFDNVRPGTTIGFSHGFILGHLKNIKKQFPKDINVIMMAPKGMGPTLRDKYLEGSGINSSISIEQTTIKGTFNASDIALAWAVGVGSPYIFKTNMEKEYISDIFGERAILLGGVHGIVEYLYRKYSNLYPTDIAFQKSVGSLTGPLSQKISSNGLLKVYQDMPPRDQKIFKINFIKSYNICYNLFEEIYEEVKNGNEIRNVISTSNKEMSLIGDSPMWKIGDKCFKNSTNLNLTEEIEPMTAGLYIGAMMAQIDILILNKHSYSEIINESIIEATDSLNPYMNEKGISYMIDNCSTTARLGARKWAPRLDYLLEQNMDRFSLFNGFDLDNLNEKNIKIAGLRNDYDIFSKFENHNIHTAFDTIKKIVK